MVTPVKQDRNVAGRRPSLQNVGMNILGPSPVGNRNKASDLKASPPLAKLDETQMTDRPKSRSSSRGSSRSSGKKKDEPKPKLVINVKPMQRLHDPQFDNKLKDLRGFPSLKDPELPFAEE